MTRLWLLPLLLCVAAGVNPPLPARAETPIGEVHYSRLANGLQLVVVVRHELQLVAVNTTVNLGAIDDPPGQWGIAHLLEHVTLQGSTSVGSLNPTAEAAAVDELDRAYAAVDRQRRQEVADPGILAGLERWFEEAQEAATKQAEAGEILEADWKHTARSVSTPPPPPIRRSFSHGFRRKRRPLAVTGG